jgi:hypothetical protein
MNIGLPWFDILPYEEKIYWLNLANRMEENERKKKIKLIKYYYRIVEPKIIKEEIKNGIAKKRTRAKASRENSRMRFEVIERHGFTCHICSKPIHYTDFSIDHIIPISRGGTQDLDNLLPAHKVCNSQKSNKLPIKGGNYDQKVTA